MPWKESASERSNIVRILVAKGVTDTQRQELLGRVAEQDGKLVHEATRMLVSSKGRWTPRVRAWMRQSKADAARVRERSAARRRPGAAGTAMKKRRCAFA